MSTGPQISYLAWGTRKHDAEVMLAYLYLFAAGLSHESIVKELQAGQMLAPDDRLPLQTIYYWREQNPTWAFAQDETRNDPLWFNDHIAVPHQISIDNAMALKYARSDRFKGFGKRTEYLLQQAGRLNPEPPSQKSFMELLIKEIAGKMQPALPAPPVIDITPKE